METGEEDSTKAILWACGDIGGCGGSSMSSVRQMQDFIIFQKKEKREKKNSVVDALAKQVLTSKA